MSGIGDILEGLITKDPPRAAETPGGEAPREPMTSEAYEKALRMELSKKPGEGGSAIIPREMVDAMRRVMTETAPVAKTEMTAIPATAIVQPQAQSAPAAMRPNPFSGGVPSETTQLSQPEEYEFQDWAKAHGINNPDDPDQHYDYRGAFKGGLEPDKNGHWSDQYKQHGHPTFSVESVYSKGPGDGGTWSANDEFIPSPGTETGGQPVQPVAPATPPGPLQSPSMGASDLAQDPSLQAALAKRFG